MAEKENELYCGIGIQRDIYDLNRFIVQQIHPLSQADEAGLRVGDRITAVQQGESDQWQRINPYDPAESNAMMRGAPGTQVRLQGFRIENGNAVEFETALINRSMFTPDPTQAITGYDTNECGEMLLGDLPAPPRQIASSEPGVTPHSIPRL